MCSYITLICVAVKTGKNWVNIHLHFNTLHFDTPRISGLIQRGLFKSGNKFLNTVNVRCFKDNIFVFLTSRKTLCFQRIISKFWATRKELTTAMISELHI